MSGADRIKKEFTDGIIRNDAQKLIYLLQYYPKIIEMDLDCNGIPIKPLELAVAVGHFNAVRVLIEVGKANVNIRDSEGRTILHEKPQNMNYEIVKYIIEETCFDLSAKDDEGICIFRIMLINLFLQFATQPHARSIPEEKEQLLSLFSEKYFERKLFTSELLTEFYVISSLYKKHYFLKNIFNKCFDWKKVTPEHILIKVFIEIFKVESNPKYYGFCIAMLEGTCDQMAKPNLLEYKNSKQSDSFVEDFEIINNRMVTNLLKSSFDDPQKLKIFTNCLKLAPTFARDFIFNKKCILSINIEPVTLKEKRGLLKFFKTLHELEVQYFNYYAFRNDDYVCQMITSDVSGIKLKLLWPFVYGTHVSTTVEDFYMMVDAISLKELARKEILYQMYDENVPHQEFVKKVESLKLPKELIRYLRFMDEFPEID